MTALFWSLALLSVACFVTVLAVDGRVRHAGSWESIDRWLLVGSCAAPAGLIALGATVGVGLAWGVS